MASNELRNKPEETLPSVDDWIYLQQSESPYEVKKVKLGNTSPIGEIKMIADTTAPPNYLFCDGSVCDDSLPILKAHLVALGNPYGSSGGHPLLPNYQGLSPKGVGNATISGRVKTGPVSLGSVQEDQMQGWQAGASSDNTGSRNYWGRLVARDFTYTQAALADHSADRWQRTTQGGANMIKAMNDGTNGDPRTGLTTRDSTIGTNFFIRYK